MSGSEKASSMGGVQRSWIREIRETVCRTPETEEVQSSQEPVVVSVEEALREARSKGLHKIQPEWPPNEPPPEEEKDSAEEAQGGLQEEGEVSTEEKQEPVLKKPAGGSNKRPASSFSEEVKKRPAGHKEKELDAAFQEEKDEEEPLDWREQGRQGVPEPRGLKRKKADPKKKPAKRARIISGEEKAKEGEKKQVAEAQKPGLEKEKKSSGEADEKARSDELF